MTKKISIYSNNNTFLGYVFATHEYAVELGCIAHRRGVYIAIFADHWRVW